MHVDVIYKQPIVINVTHVGPQFLNNFIYKNTLKFSLMLIYTLNT